MFLSNYSYESFSGRFSLSREGGTRSEDERVSGTGIIRKVSKVDWAGLVLVEDGGSIYQIRNVDLNDGDQDVIVKFEGRVIHDIWAPLGAPRTLMISLWEPLGLE